MSRAGLLERKILPYPRRSQHSPSTARREPPVPLHLRTRGRGRDNHWLFHGQHRSRGPRHASGRLSLRFGPGDWAGSDPLAGEGEPGARVGVTHPRGVGPPASRPRLPERCRRQPVLSTAAGLPEAPSEPFFLRREPVHASACVISRRPSECSQLDSSGLGMPGYRGPVSIATD